MAANVESKPVQVSSKHQPENVEKIVHEKRESGKVKFYHRLKRFGVVIADEDNEEFLVLNSEIRSYRSYGLEEGERVEFVAGVGVGRNEKNMALQVTRGPLCFTCDQEGHIARYCLRRPKRSAQPKRSQGEGNRSGGGRSVKGPCYNCRKPGHIERNCQEPAQGVTPVESNDGVAERACYNCGKAGHLKKTCPEQRQASGGSCFGCGETGHFKRDCPNSVRPTN